MSKSTNGKFAKLDTAPTDGTAQPSLRVGNVVSGMGTVEIKPDSPVIADTAVEFTITFTAAGRMVTNVDGTMDNNMPGEERAGIQIVFPFNITKDHDRVS